MKVLKVLLRVAYVNVFALSGLLLHYAGATAPYRKGLIIWALGVVSLIIWPKLGYSEYRPALLALWHCRLGHSPR